MSFTVLPASCWRRKETIWVSVNLFFFIIEPFKLENFSKHEWSNFGGAYNAIEILRFGQYAYWLATGQGGIDSTWMKDHYKIFWPQWVSQGIPFGEISQHEIMATDYKKYFLILLKSMYDQSVNIATRDTMLVALGMGGLDSTTAWNMLPSSIQCKYNLINIIGGGGKTGYQSNSCGAAFNADTLGLKPPCRN